MEALVEVKNNYGARTVYPANQTAELLAQLAGTKTLTETTITLAKQLGYKFTVKPETV